MRENLVIVVWSTAQIKDHSRCNREAIHDRFDLLQGRLFEVDVVCAGMKKLYRQLARHTGPEPRARPFDCARRVGGGRCRGIRGSGRWMGGACQRGRCRSSLGQSVVSLGRHDGAVRSWRRGFAHAPSPELPGDRSTQRHTASGGPGRNTANCPGLHGRRQYIESSRVPSHVPACSGGKYPTKIAVLVRNTCGCSDGSVAARSQRMYRPCCLLQVAASLLLAPTAAAS